MVPLLSTLNRINTVCFYYYIELVSTVGELGVIITSIFNNENIQFKIRIYDKQMINYQKVFSNLSTYWIAGRKCRKYHC